MSVFNKDLHKGKVVFITGGKHDLRLVARGWYSRDRPYRYRIHHRRGDDEARRQRRDRRSRVSRHEDLREGWDRWNPYSWEIWELSKEEGRKQGLKGAVQSLAISATVSRATDVFTGSYVPYALHPQPQSTATGATDEDTHLTSQRQGPRRVRCRPREGFGWPLHPRRRRRP